MRIFSLKGSKKRRAALVALAIAGSVVGVAIAAWTTGGSGSGQASAGSASACWSIFWTSRMSSRS